MKPGLQQSAIPVVLSILLLVTGSAAWAQSREPEGTATPARRGPPTGLGFRLRGGAVHQFDSGLPGGGRFDVTRSVVEGSVRYAFSANTFLGLSASYAHDLYGFSPGARIGSQRPWSQIQTLRLSVPMFAELGRDWRLLAIPIVRLTAERAEDWGEGVTGGGIFGFSFRVGEGLRIGPGVGFLTELEDDPTIFPVIVVDWQVTDRLRLDTGRGLGATEGPGLVASYRFMDWLTGSVGFRFDRLRFRLESNTAAQGGIGQDQGFPVLAGVTIGYPFAQLSVFGGARFGGRLSIADSEGRTLVERDYGTAPLVGASFQLFF